MVDKDYKIVLVENLKSKVADTGDSITLEIERLVESEKEFSVLYKKSYGIDQEMIMQQWMYAKKRVEQLEYLKRSPFFAKMVYDDGEKDREVYISKFEYSADGIYSWVAPIAELRFEDLGDCIVNLPEKKLKTVNLKQKDHYVITDDKIIYYSQEDAKSGVQIIHEDFLSTVKSEYGLSEIVSKIEKEQYAIIQADHKKELIISGPAGSGKTTICLHRVAYLLQTPETSDVYAGKNMIMFVQDRSTKDYFSSILPKLGIPNMSVLTYFEWGILILDISDCEELNLSGIDEEYLEYLEERAKVLEKSTITFKKFGKSFEEELAKLYKKYLQKRHYELFVTHQNNHRYDYLDVTIMLSMMTFEGGLYKEGEFHRSLGNGTYRKYLRKTKVEYGMIIVDEFQNYSYDQISVLKKCIQAGNTSIVYIGDVNQKSLLKPETVHYHSHFEQCEKVELNKVYRNTKQILEFIQSEGYTVEIPEQAKEGVNAEKYVLSEDEELLSFVQTIIQTKKEDETFGILCDGESMKARILKSVETDDRVKVMTKLESQGTEFNSVICINEKKGGERYSERFMQLMESVNRNADYIGYTRAIERLVVVVV